MSDLTPREAIESAHELVALHEQMLAMEVDPTLIDVAETRLRQALADQDTILANAVAAMEREDARLDEIARQVMLPRDDPQYFYLATKRSSMSLEVKARVIRRYGRARYMELPLRCGARTLLRSWLRGSRSD
jgi:hypothetical protein